MGFSLDIEGRLERRWPFGRRVYAGFQRADVGFLANAVAFQAFGALLPMLVVTFVLVALVAGDALADRVLALTQGVLPERTGRLIANSVAAQLRSTSASVLGVAVLLWGALNLFKGLDTAFSTVYRTRSENSLLEQTRDALVVFGALLAALLAAVVAGGLPVLANLPLYDYVAPVALLIALVAVFLPMYYVFPDVDLSLRRALPGAVVAAVGWTILQLLFQVYVALTAGDGSGGVVGAVLLLLTWLYFGSFLLLLGAVVNAETAPEPVDDPSGDRSVPAPQ